MEYDVTSDLPAGTAECTEPLSSMEHAVAALWSEVLQTSRLPGPSDNFFALGGNSMTMVMLEYRIQEELAIELPSGALLGTPTLRELSELLEAERGAASNSENASMETGTTGA